VSEAGSGTGLAGAVSATRWDAHDVDDLPSLLGVPRVEAFRTIGSTSDRAKALAHSGAPAWSVVVADEQTAGRGRRGASWISDEGAGLWMSVVLKPSAPDAPLPLVVGLACAEAIERVAPEIAVGVKWPNDLVVGDGKVGGILCEAAGDAVVVGVGINVSRAPTTAEVSDQPVTALEVEAGTSLSRSDLAGAILDRLRVWTATESTRSQAIRVVSRRDVLEGVTVVSEQAGVGRGAGIDEGGALLLDKPDGSRARVISGRVRRASSSP